MASFVPALCSVTLRTLPPAQVIALCTEHRIRAIEWGGDVHVPHTALDVADAVSAACAAANLAVASYGSYVFAGCDGGLGPLPSQPADAALDTTLRLGAPNMRVWAGNQASKHSNAAHRSRVADALRTLCDRAAAHDLTMSLEHHVHTLTDDADSAVALINEVDRHNLFLHWQPRPGLAVDDALRELACVQPHLSHLHVFAWDRKGTRYALSAHRDYWLRVLEFAATTSNRWCSERYAFLEFVKDDAPAQFMDDARELRSWLT